MDTKLCYIYGPPASGKGILCRLLDGHSNLGVTPIHDTFPKLLETFNPRNVEEAALFYKLRRNITKTRYYNLEDFAHHRSLQTEISAESRPEEPIELDFYQMEQDWTAAVNTDMRTTEVIKNIFHSLFENITDYSYKKSRCQYYVGMGAVKPGPMESLIHENEDSKVIFISRDPRAVVASKGSRPNRSIEDFIKRGWVLKSKKHFQKARSLKDEHPDRVLIIHFEDLILNTDQTMDKISEFLDIRPEKILYTPSFSDKELTPKSDYVGEIKDDWEDLVSKDEKYALDLQAGRIPPGINMSGMKLYMKSLIRKAIKHIYEKVSDSGKKIINR